MDEYFGIEIDQEGAKRLALKEEWKEKFKAQEMGKH